MKAEKTLLIEDILRRVNASPFMLVVDYTGLKVDKFAELRKRLNVVGSEIHVFKNNLVKKAAEKAGYPGELGDHLTGQSAFVTGAKDVFGAAKILGVTRHALKRRIIKHRIEWPRARGKSVEARSPRPRTALS